VGEDERGFGEDPKAFQCLDCVEDIASRDSIGRGQRKELAPKRTLSQQDSIRNRALAHMLKSTMSPGPETHGNEQCHYPGIVKDASIFLPKTNMANTLPHQSASVVSPAFKDQIRGDGLTS